MNNIDKIEISTAVLAIALTLATQELSKKTGEPALVAKQRLVRLANQKFNTMNPTQTNAWVKKNYPLPKVMN